MPYLDLNMHKNTVDHLCHALKRWNVTKKEATKAFEVGLKRLEDYHSDIKNKATEILEKAEQQGKQTVVLVGRPYHIDNEINHGINKLLTSLGLAVLTEDSVFDKTDEVKVNVLNQWTYHARLYRAADFVCKHDNVNLVQLVSFGCGIDAITTDEIRSIMEKNGKLYTQIKIDEINNLGVVRIRLRSMLAAIEEAKAKKQ